MIRTIQDFTLDGKRVLLRCDFNVPLDKRGCILDDFRIKKTIPTIEYLVKRGAKIILMSHLDDPGGKVVESLRLTPVQEKLMEYLDLSVTKAPNCIGRDIEKWVDSMQPGEILLLENLRFHQEEEEGDLNFAKKLAKLGDIYINEAFSVCHRSHASIVGLARYLPAGAGLLLEKEIEALTNLMKSPEKPLLAIIGGKKVETKAKLIDKISEMADSVLIGGLIKKEIEEKKIKLKNRQKIISPVDSVLTFDIGPKTREHFKEKISQAKTIFWSGPLGMTEEEEFTKGSKEIARAIIKSGAISIVGGRETVEFINRIGLIGKFGYVSTGGGAMLQFLSGEKLPGIEALNYKLNP